MTWLQYAIVAAVACITTMALVPPVKRLAFKIDAVDYPSERRVNKQPTARFGGVAMFGGLLCGLAVIIGGVAFFDWHFPLHSFVTREISYPGIFAGITLAFLVGVADDIFDLRPMHKFLGQVIAATIVAASGLLLTDMMNPFGHEQLMFGWLSYPITVFYLVAFCNVINLIDGLDGLAAGITAISSAAMVVFAILTVRPEAAFFGLALVGVCAGFLRYNFHPASIFMGIRDPFCLACRLALSHFRHHEINALRFAAHAHHRRGRAGNRYGCRHHPPKASAPICHASRSWAHPPPVAFRGLQPTINRSHHVGMDSDFVRFRPLHHRNARACPPAVRLSCAWRFGILRY